MNVNYSIQESLISIIVPIYKVEKYLNQCIDSIINQTYRNLEIILVDDESPDNCGKMCDEYASKDSRIVVLHKKNGGLSSARNAGIGVAKGEFIMFVDSDDYLPKFACEQLHAGVSFFKGEIASVAGQFYKDVGGNISSYNKKWEVNVPKLISYKDYLCQTLCEEISFTVTAKLFKTDIIRKISFREGKTNEDTLFTYNLALLYEKEKLNEIVIPDFVYYYRIRPNSICTSSETPLVLTVFQNQREILKKDNKQHPEFEKKYFELYTSKLYNFCFKALNREDWRKKYFKQHSNYFSEVPIKTIFNIFKGKNLIKAISLYYFPCLLNYKYKIKK